MGVCVSNIYFISRISLWLPLRIGLTEILMVYIESAIAFYHLLRARLICGAAYTLLNSESSLLTHTHTHIRAWTRSSLFSPAFLSEMTMNPSRSNWSVPSVFLCCFPDWQPAPFLSSHLCLCPWSPITHREHRDPIIKPGHTSLPTTLRSQRACKIPNILTPDEVQARVWSNFLDSLKRCLMNKVLFSMEVAFFFNFDLCFISHWNRWDVCDIWTVKMRFQKFTVNDTQTLR